MWAKRMGRICNEFIYCNESGYSHGEKLSKYINMAKKEDPKLDKDEVAREVENKLAKLGTHENKVKLWTKKN